MQSAAGKDVNTEATALEGVTRRQPPKKQQNEKIHCML
jgi:hypothetical protein